MTWCNECRATPGFFLASSAICCRFVYRFAGFRVPSHVSRQQFSSSWRLPSLHRVPSVRFPAFADTTETLRHPALPTSRLWFRFQLPRFPHLFRVSLARSCQTGGGLFRPGAFRCRHPPFRLLPRGQHRTSQVPWQSIHASAMFQDPGRVKTPSPHDGRLDAAPVPNTTKAPAVHDFVANYTALASAVYASRTELPLPMQD
jgi:hypothetical protein